MLLTTLKPSPSPRTLALKKKVDRIVPELDTKNFLAVRLLQSKILPLRHIIKGPHPLGSRETRNWGKAGRVSRPRPTEKGAQVTDRPYHRKPLSTSLLPLQPQGAVRYSQLLPTRTFAVFHPLPGQAFDPAVLYELPLST